MKENTRPMLSVACPTYNHEFYIRQALDSILMQKINFTMEIIVGEDCSTDGTRVILKEYEEKYPGVFTMLYRDKNMGMQASCRDVYLHCKGKYIAYLECDDFWLDPYKLQKQVDYLEAHPDVVACYHHVVVVGDDGKPNGEKYPECPSEFYTLWEYRKECMPGQSSSLVCRNYNVDNLFDTSIFEDTTLSPGDRVQSFVFAENGGVHCMKEQMGAYRHVTNHGSSYSATVRRSGYRENMHMAWLYGRMLEYAREKAMSSDARRTLEQLYLWRIAASSLRGKGEADRPSWLKTIKGLEYKTAAVGYCGAMLASLPVRRFIAWRRLKH